jgi:hypothetical protein
MIKKNNLTVFDFLFYFFSLFNDMGLGPFIWIELFKNIHSIILNNTLSDDLKILFRMEMKID